MKRLAVALCVVAACSPTTPGAPAWRPIATDGLAPRWGQVAAYDARRDRMLVYGGENGSGQLGEVLALDLATERWSHVDTTGTPRPRTDLTGIVDATRDRLIVVGGRVGLFTSIDEVWALDLGTNVWTPLPSGPPARHDVPAATDGAHLWVYGGAGDVFQSLNDLWELDLATDTWRQRTWVGDGPPARTSSALAFSAGGIYLHGGHDAGMAQHDTWRYDLASSTWTRLEPAGGTVAAAHFGYAYDATCGALFLSGGDNLDNFDTALTDALVLAPPAHFARVPAATLPPPRDHPSMILDPVRHQLVLYAGGTVGDGLGTLGDAWAYPIGACP